MSDDNKPQSGGAVSVYSLPTNLGMFDMTAALDGDISDGARGILYRILALHERHSRMYGMTNPFRILMAELVNGAPGGLAMARSYLRELAGVGYVRKWQEQDGSGKPTWVIEAAPIRAFDGDTLREDNVQVPVLTAKPKRAKKAATTPRKKAVKVTAKPGYHEIVLWLQSPDGGDYKVPTVEWGRVGKSINTILEIAVLRGWLPSEDVPTADDLADLLYFVEQCWKWIKEGTPYRGKIDIHNCAAKLQEWWQVEGVKKYGQANEAPSYMPVSI